jgi:hypothetical protein
MTREKSLSIRFGSVKSKSSNACRDEGRNEEPLTDRQRSPFAPAPLQDLHHYY